MRFQHRTPADYRVMPWANGRGQTIELVRLEDATGKLQLRLSIADVVEAGAFSQLPGIDRVLTLIEGDGFDLDFGGAAPSVTALPFKPIAFSGNWATSATNLRGPSRDFNVMTARGRYEVDVSCAASASITPADLICLYVVSGSAEVALGQQARRCEERNDEAIRTTTAKSQDCCASLVMTEGEEMVELHLRARDLLVIDGFGHVDVGAAGDVLAIRLTPRCV